MSGPFVSEERFDIVVKYVNKKLPSGVPTVLIIDSGELEERYKGSVQEIHTQWIQPNWIETNKLVRKATSFDAMAGRRELDVMLYRQLLLEQYMKNWDITTKDAEGKDISIPCTPDNINKLSPSIAGALCDAFVNKTSMQDEDLGN